MKQIKICLVLLMFVFISGYGQNPYKGEIKVNFGETTSNRDNVALKAEIDLTHAKLRSNDRILFTPLIRSLDTGEEITFAPITVSGKKRAKVIRRQQYFSKQIAQSNTSFSTTSRRSPVTTIPLHYSIPFQEWMRNSQMVVVEKTSGCCDCEQVYADGKSYKTYEGSPLLFSAPYQPDFTLSYMAPPKSEVKILQDTYSAQLTFMVNQTNLLREVGNNSRILAEADEMIYRIKSDSLLSIQRIIVRGYASPEGGAANNQRLSEGRAQSFVDYLYERHDFRTVDRVITAYGMGEDWAGLRKAIEEKGYMENKDRILDILDIPDPEKRKSTLKSLSGGRTYRRILQEVFPSLRRNEYTIEYQVRGFNAEEAREIFRTRPRLLSLEEMFMVANLCPHDSDEYKQVFDVIARFYPDSPVALLNVAAMEIENGWYDTAIKRLADANTPEALNNLAIAYWHKGEPEKTEEYLRQAARSGYKTAEENLSEFIKWVESK